MLRKEVGFNAMEDEIEEAIICNYDQHRVFFEQHCRPSGRLELQSITRPGRVSARSALSLSD
jgi:hypothetical protein